VKCKRLNLKCKSPANQQRAYLENPLKEKAIGFYGMKELVKA
jgi:hypothetical protein